MSLCMEDWNCQKKQNKAQWKKVLVMQFAEEKKMKFEMKLVAKTYAMLHYKPCGCFGP